jgi:hypothetical protein
MKDSYIVRLYVRTFFVWKIHDFYPLRAYAFQAARGLESFGIRVKLVQVCFKGEQALIYESDFKQHHLKVWLTMLISDRWREG